jgi:hypothetical protein
MADSALMYWPGNCSMWRSCRSERVLLSAGGTSTIVSTEESSLTGPAVRFAKIRHKNFHVCCVHELHITHSFEQGWIYSFGGPEAIKMWRPIAVNNKFRSRQFFFPCFLYQIKIQTTFHDFRETTTVIKFVDPFSLLCRPWCIAIVVPS